MSNLLIRGGDVVLPDGPCRADIRTVGDVVEEIRPNLAPRNGEDVIDASGLLVLPGIIDEHTHFELDTGKMQTLDDFASGSASAAAGGVTTYINFAAQQRRQSLVEAIREEQRKANEHTLVDYALHLSFGTPGEDWEAELREAVLLGVTSIKVYTTYTDTIYYTRDWDWYQLMLQSASAGMLVMVHAENDDILRGQTEELLHAGKRSFQYHAAARPEIAEIEAVSRGLSLCKETGSPVYFVHLSSPESVALVDRARADGLPAYGEVCPHHISLTDTLYQTQDATRYVMTPPLRAPSVVERLRRQVANGDVQVMGSDHCGYTLDQRGSDADFTSASPGIPGVETLWPIMYTTLVASNLMEIGAAVNLVSRNPAAIFGLAPRKGTLTPGADADILLYDPSGRTVLDERTLHSQAGYSPWNGTEVQGRVVQTISRGVSVYWDGEICGDVRHGRFVACRPFDQHRVSEELRTVPRHASAL